MAKTVKINNLTFGYKKILFDRLCYTFPTKGVVAICGQSGKGKTTLLHIIAGLIKPSDASQIEVSGKIACLFQDDRLLPWLTANDNIAILSKDGKCGDWLKKVGLENEGAKYPEELSGGMKRRVSFAAALSADADVILLDEPTANLDENNAEIIRNLIREASKNALVILASHIKEDIEIADEILNLEEII